MCNFDMTTFYLTISTIRMDTTYNEIHFDVLTSILF